MNVIKTSALAEEIITLQEISNDRTLKPREKYALVEKMGYTLEELGSGETAYTHAHPRDIHHLTAFRLQEGRSENRTRH